MNEWNLYVLLCNFDNFFLSLWDSNFLYFFYNLDFGLNDWDLFNNFYSLNFYLSSNNFNWFLNYLRNSDNTFYDSLNWNNLIHVNNHFHRDFSHQVLEFLCLHIDYLLNQLFYNFFYL